MEDDPYAISSDTDSESLKGPPPKISIEGRSVADISSLVCFFDLNNELSFCVNVISLKTFATQITQSCNAHILLNSIQLMTKLCPMPSHSLLLRSISLGFNTVVLAVLN